MRHGNKVNALGRKAAHRKATLRNLTLAIIEHKSIFTTLAKAKALRRHLEPLITKSKDNSTHSRRVVFSHLQHNEAIKELFGPIAEKVANRPGGYLRVIRTGFRQGDGAEMAMIEFVDFNEVYNIKDDKSTQSRTRRSRRGKSGSGAAKTTATTTEETTSNEEEA
jgi:large subunit ribosomal protein L17